MAPCQPYATRKSPTLAPNTGAYAGAPTIGRSGEVLALGVKGGSLRVRSVAAESYEAPAHTPKLTLGRLAALADDGLSSGRSDVVAGGSSSASSTAAWKCSAIACLSPIR